MADLGDVAQRVLLDIGVAHRGHARDRDDRLMLAALDQQADLRVAARALGMTKETALYAMWQNARLARIYEGPSEVHRQAVARRILKRYA